MRKLTMSAGFFAFVLALVASRPTGVAMAQMKPSCEGTEPSKIKCPPGTIPSGYYESATCEGDLGKLGSCKNAIAFNITWFGCTDPQDDGGSPPTYRKLCLDVPGNTDECTQQRICKGTTKSKVVDGKNVSYTFCDEDTSQYKTTYKTLKTRLTDPDCQPMVHLPEG